MRGRDDKNVSRSLSRPRRRADPDTTQPLAIATDDERTEPRTDPHLEPDECEDDGAPTLVVDMLTPHCSGPKAGLKPVFDALLDAARRLGKVKIVAGPVFVTISLGREFALLMPTPHGDRVELGLALPARPPTRRLQRVRHFNWGERFTHCVTLRYKTDVDAEVRSWLTEACRTSG